MSSSLMPVSSLMTVVFAIRTLSSTTFSGSFLGIYLHNKLHSFLLNADDSFQNGNYQFST